MTPSATLDALRDRARAAAGRSHAPYSRRPAGAAVLLADGSWIAGARVENASYPLTIPAVTAALCAARVAGVAGDIRAVVSSVPFEAGEAEAAAAFVADVLSHALALTPDSSDAMITADHLPDPGREYILALSEAPPTNDTGGVALAIGLSERAHIPASGFPVGCAVLADDGRLFGGANMEAGDWTRGLCAERVALATMISAGAGRARRVWLACARGPGCTPCGACRQVLAELAPDADIIMARGDRQAITTVAALLPGAFDATQLG